MRIILGAMLLLGCVANAETFGNCKEQIKKYDCKGDDKAIYECLLKHDKDLEGTPCDKDHSAYEEAHHLKK